MSDVVQVQIEDRVATLTLNRPDKLNALNGEMARVALKTLAPLAENPDVGCVVLTGAGRAFCAGGDVLDMAAAEDRPTSMEDHVDRLRKGQEFSWMLHWGLALTIQMADILRKTKGPLGLRFPR